MRTVCTIGYEGASIDAFVYSLGVAGINLVIDIREIAASRRPGFSKNALREHLALAGIQYTHLRGLGDPKEGREAARRGNYHEFERVYFAHLASEVAQAEMDVAVHLASNNSVALLCYERDPKHCHRSIVAAAMVKQKAFAVRHLGVHYPRRISPAKATEVEFVPVR